MTAPRFESGSSRDEWRIKALEDTVRRLEQELRELDSKSFSTRLTVSLHDDVLLMLWAMFYLVVIAVVARR